MGINVEENLATFNNYRQVKHSCCLPLHSGTDATHAEHIETIKNRCYVGVQQDGTFLPGQLGMGLVEGNYSSSP